MSETLLDAIAGLAHTTVWNVVYAHIAGERSVVIAAFVDPVAAENFKNTCTEYQATSPRVSFPLDADIAFSRDQQRLQLWEARHPAGQGSIFYKSFSVGIVQRARSQPAPDYHNDIEGTAP